jgi:hypothetical protein
MRDSFVSDESAPVPTSANIIDIWPVIGEITDTKVLVVHALKEHVDINATVIAEVRRNTRSMRRARPRLARRAIC